MAITINGNTGVAGVDGSAGTPSYQGSDSNTGMFFPAADTISFAEGGVESMRLDSSGNVGIGTSSPAERLHVQGGDIRIQQAIPELKFVSEGAVNRWYIGANISDSVDGGLCFGNGTGVGNNERMRIDSSGNLLVGATSQVGPFAQRVGVSFNGGAFVGIAIRETGAGSGSRFTSFVNSAGSEIGTIQQSGTSAVAYITSSDYRLKENIQPMTGVLEKVAALKPVTYKWKSDGSDGQGFIAHELAEVVPDCVVGEKDAVDAEGNPVYQGIDTSFLVATLTAAIQEQQAIIEQLTTRIAALEAK